MRLFVRVALVMACSVSALWLPAAPASAAVHVVQPGQSIQGVINSAQPGDTIIVRPGVYRENVHIQKSGITLRGSGASPSGTILKPPQNPRGPFKANGITIVGHVDFATGQIRQRTHDITVKGFLVKGFRDFGVFAFGTDDVRVVNMMTVGGAEYGVSGFSLHGGVFSHNTTVDAGLAGLYVGDSRRANFLLRENSSTGSTFGILIRNASHGNIVGNTLHGNCVGVLVLGGAPGPAAAWRIHGNNVFHNNRFCSGEGQEQPTSGTGIGIDGARNNLVRNNTVRDNHASRGNPSTAGGIVVITDPQGGPPPVGNRVIGNTARRNQPFDLRWDGTGTDNHFFGNDCGSSDPGGLCV
jgi:nitrous oxidase accessory protein NosD